MRVRGGRAATEVQGGTPTVRLILPDRPCGYCPRRVSCRQSSPRTPAAHRSCRRAAGVSMRAIEVSAAAQPYSTTAPRRGSAYSELSRQIKQARLLDRRKGYYAGLIALTGALCAVGVVAFLLIGDSWWQLVVAAYFAVVSTQLGFLGHDAGHRQIFTSARANRRLGVVIANLGVGFSYGWWVDKHNRHHAHPNDEDKDPDIDIGALAFTAGQARAKRGRLIRFI